MELQYLMVKIYCAGSEGIILDDFTPMFNKWIQENESDKVLVDVASYGHVPYGPGILLIGHDENYSMEYGVENKLGLLFSVKEERAGSNIERVEYAIKAAVAACKKIMQDEDYKDKIKFDFNGLVVSINDRCIVGNTEDGFKFIDAEFKDLFCKYFSKKSVKIEKVSQDPRDRLAIRVSAGDSFVHLPSV